MESAAEKNYPSSKQKIERFQGSWRELWAIPNLLSVSRLLMMPLGVAFIIYNRDLLAVAFLAFIWTTDFIDGFIARHFKMRTSLGLILDPVADKLVAAGILLALYLFRDFPLWIMLTVLLKDIIILVFGYYLIRQNTIVESNFLGRMSTVLFSIIILLYILGFEVLSIRLGYILAGLIVLTIITYGIRFQKIINSNQSI